MKLRDWLSRLSRWQRSMGFKIGASVVVLLLALGVSGWRGLVAARAEREAREDAAARLAPEPESPEGAADTRTPEQRDLDEAYLDLQQSTLRAIDRIVSSGRDPAGALATIWLGASVALIVIWIDLGLTGLGLLLAGAMVVYPLSLMPRWHDTAVVLGGVLALGGAFAALMQGAKALLGGASPVLSVARNVLAEATRMRLSLVLLIILAVAMAALPGMLSGERALRFRVQSFLQYGTGGTFWIIALLVVLFSVATVAFEQRDRLIWQTMTKPVAPWKYLLGKWLGVVVLSGVLLGVVASGIFLFTEHLRGQKALDEVAPFQAASGVGLSEDRLILETQVLSARRSAAPDVQFSRDAAEFVDGVRRYIAEQRASDSDWGIDPVTGKDDEKFLLEVEQQLYKSWMAEVFSVPPPNFTREEVYASDFSFSGLSSAARLASPVVLSYKVDAGANNPTHFYDLEFRFNLKDRGFYAVKRLAPVGVRQTITVPPAAIDDNGQLFVSIANLGLRDAPLTSEPIQFPPGGLEVSYAVSGWRMNFLRAMAILWLKLACLSMVGIACATFMSFPVACLFAVTVFLAAESTGYITKSLESYTVTDRRQKTVAAKWVVSQVATAITKVFKVYSDMKPTGRLVNGSLLSWGTFAAGVGTLTVFMGAAFAVAVGIFRRRELATYSGH